MVDRNNSGHFLKTGLAETVIALDDLLSGSQQDLHPAVLDGKAAK